MIYHHHDHLGGTHVETDSAGTAVEYTLYTPFGATLLDTKTGSYENDHKYTNKELDTDTGLYYYGARYYNPTMGVFIAQDPVFVGFGSQSVKDVQKLIRDPHRLDSYTYARNNPINAYDPDGRSSLPSPFTIVFGPIGAIAERLARELAVYEVSRDPQEVRQEALRSITSGSWILGMMGPVEEGASMARGAAQRVERAILNNVEIRSYGRDVYQGVRDLSKTLTDILRNPSSGRTYLNSNGRLPDMPAGYYTRYHINDTPNWTGTKAGPERIVTGKGGETYYTPDHYESFVQLK